MPSTLKSTAWTGPFSVSSREGGGLWESLRAHPLHPPGGQGSCEQQPEPAGMCAPLEDPMRNPRQLQAAGVWRNSGPGPTQNAAAAIPSHLAPTANPEDTG